MMTSRTLHHNLHLLGYFYGQFYTIYACFRIATLLAARLSPVNCLAADIR